MVVLLGSKYPRQKILSVRRKPRTGRGGFGTSYARARERLDEERRLER
jgi:hypothetical protein